MNRKQRRIAASVLKRHGPDYQALVILDRARKGPFTSAADMVRRVPPEALRELTPDQLADVRAQVVAMREAREAAG